MDQRYEGEIPDYVIAALEEVRQGGKHNMWFSVDVFRELYDMELYKALLWLGKETPDGGMRVDGGKYFAALMELGRINAIAYALAGEDSL